MTRNWFRLSPRTRSTKCYGKFPADGVSGGRPRYLAAPLSEADLRRCIHLLNRHGIAFNYLLNGACFGNREWTRQWQKRVTVLLTKLGDLGVHRVTVSTPFLLELVKRRFPEFRVRVGIYAQVDTPRRARFWEDLGTDAMYLLPSLTHEWVWIFSFPEPLQSRSRHPAGTRRELLGATNHLTHQMLSVSVLVPRLNGDRL